MLNENFVGNVVDGHERFELLIWESLEISDPQKIV